MFDIILIAKISLIYYNYFQTDKMKNKRFTFYSIRCFSSRIAMNGEADNKRLRSSLMIGHLVSSSRTIVSLALALDALKRTARKNKPIRESSEYKHLME